MDSTPTPQPQTLQSVYAFLRTDEWKVLVDVFEYNISDRRKKNLQKAAPFWTSLRKRNAPQTHEAWESILEQLQNIKQAMRDLPQWIDRQDHDMIRSECDSITETIAVMVNYFEYMDASFTKYLQNKQHDTVKMKYFRQGDNGLWGGKIVKCGRLFGGVQSLHWLSFLHRIYEVFKMPPNPDAHYPPRWVYWPAAAEIPDNFRYKALNTGLLIVMPDGSHQLAGPVQTNDPLEEHSLASDSSADDEDRKYDSDERVVRDSMRTFRIGPDSDDDDVVAGSRRDVPLNRYVVDPAPESDADSDDSVDLEAPMFAWKQNAHLTTMLHDLKQLSVS
jgi:hypothetical protein